MAGRSNESDPSGKSPDPIEEMVRKYFDRKQLIVITPTYFFEDKRKRDAQQGDDDDDNEQVDDVIDKTKLADSKFALHADPVSDFPGLDEVVSGDEARKIADLQRALKGHQAKPPLPDTRPMLRSWDPADLMGAEPFEE